MLKNIKKDEFLTKIIGYKCFNISNIDIHTKFEKKSFYSYIIPYSSKNLNNSQKILKNSKSPDESPDALFRVPLGQKFK